MICYWNGSAVDWLIIHNNSGYVIDRITVEILPETYFYIICGIATVVANLFVLLIAKTSVDFSVKPNQILVVCMTIADLVYGLFMDLLASTLVICLPRSLCGPYYVILWGCGNSSCMILLLLNIDKFVSLQWPLHYQSFITSTRICIPILLTVIPVFLLALFNYYGPVFEWQSDHPLTCAELSPVSPTYFALVNIVLVYITPIIISLIISVWIFYIAHKAGRGDIRGMSTMSHQSTDRIIQNKKRQKMFFKRILFVFSSTIWSTCTYLPYRIGYASYLFCLGTSIGSFGHSADRCSSSLFIQMMNIMQYLLVMSAVGNPIVTIITQRSYRVQALRLYSKMSCIPDRLRPSARMMLRRNTTVSENSSSARHRLSTDVGPNGIHHVNYDFKDGDVQRYRRGTCGQVPMTHNHNSTDRLDQTTRPKPLRGESVREGYYFQVL